jgi:hypothetical protein
MFMNDDGTDELVISLAAPDFEAMARSLAKPAPPSEALARAIADLHARTIEQTASGSTIKWRPQTRR